LGINTFTHVIGRVILYIKFSYIHIGVIYFLGFDKWF